jgi:hypothetical protein
VKRWLLDAEVHPSQTLNPRSMLRSMMMLNYIEHQTCYLLWAVHPGNRQGCSSEGFRDVRLPLGHPLHQSS